MVEDDLSFGCEPLDLVCSNLEAQAQGMSASLQWLAGLTLGNNDLAPGSSLWETAISQTGYWFGIAIVVSLAIAAIGIGMGVLSFTGRQLWWSIFGICAGIPATYVALTVGGALLEVSDQISDDLLARLGGVDGFMNVLRATQQLGTGSDVGGQALSGLLAVGGGGLFMPTAVILIVLILGMLIINFALAFRNFALMILIAFAPLAFMAVGMRGGWSLAKKWALAFVALLIAKPLMFGVLGMMLAGAKSGEPLFSGTTLTLAIGLIIVGFMPLMAFSFFSFLGAGGDIGDHVGSQLAGKAQAPGRMVTQQVGNQAMMRAGRSSGAGGAGGSGAAPAKPTAPSARNATSTSSSSTQTTVRNSSGSSTQATGGQAKVPEPPAKPAPKPAPAKPPTW